MPRTYSDAVKAPVAKGFKVLSPDKYEYVFPYFGKPIEIGGFSYDEKRKFLNNREKLRVIKYKPPLNTANLNFNLRDGYEKFIDKDETVRVPERLDHLLEWVALHPERFRLSDDRSSQAAMKSLNTDFIAWSGDLVKIMCTPYEKREGWTSNEKREGLTPNEKRQGWQMDACRYNGTIFIDEANEKETEANEEETEANEEETEANEEETEANEEETEANEVETVANEVETEANEEETEANEVETEATQERNRPTQKEMCYWGYKFEDYMTEPRVAGNRSTRVGINNSEAFCSVIRTRLRKHSIVMGAEVDCYKPSDGEAPGCYIELKTSKIMDDDDQRRTFARYKLKKFWAQSFLAGVPWVICGMRNDDGIVKKIETFETLKIPEIANEKEVHWKGAVCMNFLDSCLQWMKEVLSTTNEDGIVHTFKFDKPFQVVTGKKQARGVRVFLPECFLAKQ